VTFPVSLSIYNFVYTLLIDFNHLFKKLEDASNFRLKVSFDFHTERFTDSCNAIITLVSYIHYLIVVCNHSRAINKQTVQTRTISRLVHVKVSHCLSVSFHFELMCILNDKVTLEFSVLIAFFEKVLVNLRIRVQELD
jgi:hypothetical protein